MNPQIGFLLIKSFEYLQNSNWDTAELYLMQALKLQSNNPHTLGLLAVVNAKREQYQMALEYANKSLKILPKNALTLSNLGNIYLGLKEFEKAAEAYDKSIKLDQNYAESWLNRGNALQELNRYEEALTHYDTALILEPHTAETWSNKGNALQELKRFDEALTHYDKALNLKPNYSEAWSNKGNALQELKRIQEAIAQYNQSISLNPSCAKVYVQKGNALSELKHFEEALGCYDQALNLNADYAEAHACKGSALNQLQRFEEALGCYDQALSINADYAEAYTSKGNTLYELRQYDEAIVNYDKALNIKPDYAKSWCNKGVTLHGLERYNEAIAHYDKALSLKPDYEDGWLNKGVTLQELKRYDEAIAHFDKALSLDPDIDWALGDFLQAKMSICSWSGLAESMAILSRKVMANEKAAQPFVLLALNDDALLHKRSSETYVQSKYPFNQSLGAISKHARNQKIRVGYFSADFRNHAVSILTAELFELHNKNSFEIVAFSFGGDDEDPMRLRLRQAFNQFIDVSGLSDKEIAKLSRGLCIDIAVDLGGYTARCRTGIFSYRAAPIQLSYIGYLGTMGAEYYDYLLADRIAIPEKLQKNYSEKIAYIPSYQANDRTRSISNKKFTKAELGLPEKGFIFCCFNNSYKILPATFDCWVRILNAAEDSVLFLYAENQWVEENLKKEAKERGMADSRLVFGKRMPNDEYLSRYQACDLFLDTFPYNAGTTASDALWAGLPVLTLMGESFASRVAASLLSAIELPELITNTQEEYETLAIELAKNTQKLAEIKRKLAENRLTTPLFDTPLFTQNLESAYIKMMDRYQAGLQPDNIHVV